MWVEVHTADKIKFQKIKIPNSNSKLFDNVCHSEERRITLETPHSKSSIFADLLL